MKIVPLLFILICLSACTSIKTVENQSLQKANQGELPSSVKENNMNVEMYTKLSGNGGKSDKLQLLMKNNGEPISFSARYEIDFLKNGSWYETPFKDDIDFTMIHILVDSGKAYETTINLRTLKYELVPGKYRVVKSLYIGGGQEIYLSSTFELP